MKLPDFIIAGAQKCGTKALFDYFNLHPEIGMANYIYQREVHFFDQHYKKGIDWYKSLFNPNKICGEKTPDYITQLKWIKRMAKTAPNAKIIICLRDPVQRAYSNWHEVKAAGTAVPPLESLGPEHPIINYGFYGQQIENLYSLYRSDQVIIVINEIFINNIPNAMKHLYQFVGASPLHKTDISRVTMRPRKKPVLAAEIVDHLYNSFYKESNERLFKYIGDVPEWKH